ncbi:MAG: glycosyltransferase family A protein [Desulfobulbus sp.]|nr:glycosyltransferase family A protein [Desulfobulbus sp.]
MVNRTTYIIVTPAFNEAAFIEQTIESVLRQTILPQRWLIIDDSSTDTTGKIIQKYAEQYDFIHYYFRAKLIGQKYFASSVFAIMEGYEQIRHLPHDFLAILDADIRLPADYYKRILDEFDQDKQLGVASGVYENLIDNKLYKVLSDRRSTPKAIQVFRREVFEQIGGFLPMPYGGEDSVACVMTRMAGKKAWSFPDIKVVHLRPTGTGAATTILAARFRQGIAEYHLASHPLFFVLKVLRRIVLERPYFIGGILRLAGYLWAAVRRHKHELPKEVIAFIRKEQLARVFKGNGVK